MRVLHLTGSSVDAFWADLSIVYAARCLELNGGSDDVIAYVDPRGHWSFPQALDADALAAAEPLPVSEALVRIAAARIDVMVPQQFDLPGMTAYRALFDVLGIPYVGNTADVMALAADKAKARAVVAAAGVRIPDGEVVVEGQMPTLTPPVVVKPVRADNSVGVGLVRDDSELPRALEAALGHDGAALVERYVELGREVRCGLIERDGRLLALPLEEYAVADVRTYDDKLAADSAGGLRLVAKGPTRSWIVDASDPVTAPVQEAARRCHDALGCRHHSLFDFRVDPGGHPHFLEASPYCSFSDQSVVVTMAAAAGIDLHELYRISLEGALDETHRPLPLRRTHR